MRMSSASSTTRPRAWIVIAIVLAIVATLKVLRHRPPTATTIRSVASACRRDYAAARTAGDSAVIDDRVWVLDHGWRRIPSCGELRRSGAP